MTVIKLKSKSGTLKEEKKELPVQTEVAATIIVHILHIFLAFKFSHRLNGVKTLKDLHIEPKICLFYNTMGRVYNAYIITKIL